MADETHESPERPDNGRSGSGSDSAARAALRVAAIAAGTAAARPALRSSGSAGTGVRGTLASVLLSAWEAAQEHVLPPAEDAMEAIGRFLATDGPEVLRDRLVPRLVEGFEDAREDEGGSSRSGD